MGIHVQIDLSPRQKKIMRAAVVAGTVIAALGIGIAIAAPHQWKANDTLAAADLNGLNVLSYATPDGGTSQYSVGATSYCGSTATAFTGNIGGRGAAKKQCELACSSATAHMCTYDELARSRTVGMSLAYPGGAACLWYASGGPQYYYGSGSAEINDCAGWASSAGPNTGYLNLCWASALDGSRLSWCSNAYPIACCD